MSEINPGDVVRLYTSPAFTNAAGVATDPTTVTLRWRYHLDADWTEWVYGTDAEVVKDGAGDFHADVPITRAERLYYQWAGTGAVTAAEGSSILVHQLPGVIA